MGEDCKDCPYQLGNDGRITKLEKDMDNVWQRLRTVEDSSIRQEKDTLKIFEILDELKSSLKNIELAVYNREDPFKKAIYDLGIYVLKMAALGGIIIWAANYTG